MTRGDIIKWAQEAGVSIRGHYDETGSTPAELQRFAELVAAATREACAKVCATIADEAGSPYARECASEIRARNEKGTTE